MRVAAVVLACAFAAGCGGKAHPRAPKPPPVKPLPASAYAHYLRGRIAMREGQFALASQRFRAAAASAPGEAPIRVALIQALRRAGHGGEALRELNRALSDFPRDADVWIAAGNLYRGLRRRPAAVNAFERSVALAPDEERAYLGLAGALGAMGRTAEVEKTYRALLRHVPDSVTGHYRLARIESARRDFRAALPHLRQAIELDPDHIEARVALARALRATGDVNGAVDTLRQAFDRSGGDPDVGDQLFHQLLDVGDRKGAVELLGLLDRDDLDAETRIAFGYLDLQIGENQAALALANKLLANDPRSGDARLLRAQALDAMGRGMDGLAPLLDLHPDETAYAQCRAFAAELLARAGQNDRALTMVTDGLAAQPTSIDLIISHALVFERRGDGAQARAVFEDALRDRPGNSDLIYAYGSLIDRLGDPVRAEAIIGEILARNPNDAGALNFIGYSLADRNADLPRAQRMVERAVELSPGNGYVLDSLGWVQFRQGRLNEAFATLRRAARLAPREPEILWHLAELRLSRGQRQKALALLEQAAALRPEGRVRTHIDARLRALRSP